LWQAARTLVPIVLLGLVPLALATYYVSVVVPSGSLGVDFRASFWPAAHAVLHGGNPYPALDARVLADRTAFVYPPLVAIVLAPVGLLPVGVATAMALAVTVAALAATLWVLGVRDWRCYSVSLASPAVLASIQTASLSALLALGIALAWKRRAHGWTAPLLIVIVIVAKLFLWPLLVWLAIVRGVRSAMLAGVAAAALVVAPWVLGFPGAREYPRLLSLLTDVEGRHAYTPRALALALGAGTTVAEGIAISAGGAVLLLAVAIRRTESAGRRTLVLTLLAALLLSPLVWAHYFVVLLPAIAVAHRRLSPVWFALWGLWLAGGTWMEPSAPQIGVSLGVMLLVTLGSLKLPRAAQPVRAA
jgi:alpha-1,2-mannosyltransferase